MKFYTAKMSPRGVLVTPPPFSLNSKEKKRKQITAPFWNSGSATGTSGCGTAGWGAGVRGIAVWLFKNRPNPK